MKHQAIQIRNVQDLRTVTTRLKHLARSRLYPSYQKAIQAKQKKLHQYKCINYSLTLVKRSIFL